MKKLLLSFCFICFFITTKNVYGQTNVYHPLPDSGYYWNVIDLYVGTETGSPDTIQAFFNHFTIFGDTIVEGNRYLKVFKTNEDYSIIALCGYYREDTLNRKIYMVTDDPLDYTITGDTLLYDFNIEVGASVDSFYEFRRCCGDATENSVVIVVDSIEIEDTYRRRIGIKYDINQVGGGGSKVEIDTLYWIEGIGSTVGLTLPNHIPLNFTGENVSDVLTCVYKGDSAVFTNLHEWHSCDSITGDIFPGFEEIIQNGSISIYPIPADNFINIEMNQLGIFTEYVVELYNISGNLIYKKVEKGNSFSISSNKINSGIYFLKIFSEDQVIYNSTMIISH